MCVYDSFAHDASPKFGDVCHVTFVHLHPDTPDGISGYSLQEHPVPWPYRFGAWRVGPGGRLVPNFISIEDAEGEDTEDELMGIEFSEISI